MTINRENWPSGPWDKESDKEAFIHAGLPCLLIRGPVGAWCGYVGILKNHPLHGINYGDRAPELTDAWKKRKEQPVGDNPSFALMLRMLGDNDNPSPDVCFDVHGGLTFSNFMKGEHPIDTWWYGFDCSHAWDVAPEILSFTSRADGVYRDQSYVKHETKKLADQLAILK